MFRFFSNFKSTKKYTLVISGGGARGFYALGIVKGLEELGIDKDIENIYGVSAGGIIASYRGAGYRADQIFDLFIDFGLSSSFNFLPKKSLFKHDKLRERFEAELPATFEQLKRKIFIGCTDISKSEYILFDKGNLIEPLLGTMSIPGAFIPIKYEKYTLMDGGLINNFPVDIAKSKNPKNELIGIFLNYFKPNQEIKGMYDSLRVALEILMRSQALGNLRLVDHLFYKKIAIGTLELNKKKMTESYNMGYRDSLEYFKKHKL